MKWIPAAAAALALVLPALAHAQAKPSYGELSPRLGEISSPALRSATPGEQAEAVDLPRRGAGSLVRTRAGAVLVEIRMAGHAAAQVDELRAAGARIVNVSEHYDVVTAAVDPRELRAVAGVRGVEVATEVLAPQVAGTDAPPVGSLNTCAGAATSEADLQLNAASLRSAMELDGVGVKVGALSDSYDRGPGSEASDIASGDLPGAGNPCGRTAPVEVLDDRSIFGNIDEGRAMLQLVHDLAPGSDLAFATAFTGETAFADNIRRLQAAGAKVIVDDVTYFSEPFFQDGPISVAVNDVTAQGAAYFSSAANNNLRDGLDRDIGSWETASFRKSLSCPTVDPPDPPAPEPAEAPLAYLNACMDFNPGAGDDNRFAITVADGVRLRVVLQWQQPRGGVTTDIDAYVVDAAGNELARSEAGNTAAAAAPTQQAYELVTWDNTTGTEQTVDLVLNRYTAAGGGDDGTPRVKFILAQNGGGVTATDYPQSSGPDIVGPTIMGHNGAANASSVAAVNRSSTSALEPYSSRGPVKHYFGPVSGATPAAPIAERVLNKPDIAATDCTSNTFFGGGNVFCGTSAAAPHAAAVAALQLQGNPGLTPAQVRAAQAASGRPVGGFGASAIGAGLVDAMPAVQSVALPPVLTVTAPPPATNDATPSIPFGANRPVSVACTLDGAAVAACASPFTPTLADGPHTFVVRGVDAAGRTGESAPASFVVDTVTPDTSVTSGPGFARSRRPLFGFRASESSARFECSFDRGAFVACSGPGATARPAARLSNGGHRFRVRAVDAATNTDASPAERRFTVDTVRPRVKLRSRPARRSAARRARFTFKASERVSKFECRIDGRRLKRCRSGVRVKVRPGRHLFRVRAVDRAGNRSAVKQYRWRRIA
jgi:hypothetical protein